MRPLFRRATSSFVPRPGGGGPCVPAVFDHDRGVRTPGGARLVLPLPADDVLFTGAATVVVNRACGRVHRLALDGEGDIRVEREMVWEGGPVWAANFVDEFTLGLVVGDGGVATWDVRAHRAAVVGELAMTKETFSLMRNRPMALIATPSGIPTAIHALGSIFHFVDGRGAAILDRAGCKVAAFDHALFGQRSVVAVDWGTSVDVFEVSAPDPASVQLKPMKTFHAAGADAGRLVAGPDGLFVEITKGDRDVIVEPIC